jgi:hypothetical protein
MPRGGKSSDGGAQAARLLGLRGRYRRLQKSMKFVML